jgi:hypothetical protein
LGCRPHGIGIEDIHRHPWFSDVDWDTLDNKEGEAPFVPDVRPIGMFPVMLLFLTAFTDEES